MMKRVSFRQTEERSEEKSPKLQPADRGISHARTLASQKFEMTGWYFKWTILL